MIEKILWFCAGANVDVLENECPHECGKYAGIGATILFTAILSGLSGSYAINMVFNTFWISILLGFFWSAVIFNLDRYMISSMKKSEHILAEIIYSLPRLALAVIISVVIAKPIELRIFEQEILAQLDYEYVQYSIKIDESLNEKKVYIDKLQSEISQIRTLSSNELQAISQLEDNALQEADGSAGTKKKGTGIIYNIKLQRVNQAREGFNRAEQKRETEIQHIQNKISLITDEVNAERDKALKSKQQATGLLARISGLKNLEDKQAIVGWTNFFIMSFFFALELAPILTKLISHKSSYDEIINRKDTEIMRRNQLMVYKLDSDSDALKAVYDDKNHNRIALEKHKNKEILAKLKDATNEVTDKIVEAWTEDELGKVSHRALEFSDREIPNPTRRIKSYEQK